jgi:hypothetical protein
MKIKNYLVLKNYYISDSFYLFQKGIELDTKREEYNKMESIVVRSANHYLRNLDEIIIHRENVRNDQEMFKDHMYRIMALYKSEPCNILYCDLDIVFIKAVDIFNMIDVFAMPDTNCGVRYYPYSKFSSLQSRIMNQETKDWDTSQTFSHSLANPLYKWDREQDIYQKIAGVEGRNNQIMNSLVHQVYHEYTGASIIHCNGTNTNKNTSDDMELFYNLSLAQNYRRIKNILHSPPYDRQHTQFPIPKWSTGYRG